MLFLTYYGGIVLYGWLVFLCILQAVQTVLALNNLFKDVCSVFVQPWKTDSSVCLSTSWECFVKPKRWRLQKLHVLITHATDCADVTWTIVSPGTEILPIFRPLAMLLIMKPFSHTQKSPVICQPPWKCGKLICYPFYKKVKPETFCSSWHQLIKIPVYKTISQTHAGRRLSICNTPFLSKLPWKSTFCACSQNPKDRSIHTHPSSSFKRAQDRGMRPNPSLK